MRTGLRRGEQFAQLGNLEVGDRFHWEATPDRIFTVQAMYPTELQLSRDGHYTTVGLMTREWRENSSLRYCRHESGARTRPTGYRCRTRRRE